MLNTNLNSLVLKTVLVGDANRLTAADRIGAGFGVVADMPPATFLSQGRSQQPRLSPCEHTIESCPGSTVGQQEHHATWREPLLQMRLKPSRGNRALYLEPTSYQQPIDCDCQSLDGLPCETGSSLKRLPASRRIDRPLAATN